MIFARFSKEEKLPKFEETRLESSLSLLKNTIREVSETAACAARNYEDHNPIVNAFDEVEGMFVLVKDHEGKWKHLTKVGQKLLGVKEFKDHSSIDLQTKDIANFVKSDIKSEEFVWECERPVSFEQEINGKWFDFIKKPLFNSDGSRQSTILIGWDMSKEHSNLVRMQVCFSALNKISDGILILDKDSNIVFMNDSMINYYEDYIKIGDFELEKIKEVFKTRKPWNGNLKNGVCSTIVPLTNGSPESSYCMIFMRNSKEVCGFTTTR